MHTNKNTTNTDSKVRNFKNNKKIVSFRPKTSDSQKPNNKKVNQKEDFFKTKDTTFKKDFKSVNFKKIGGPRNRKTEDQSENRDKNFKSPRSDRGNNRDNNRSGKNGVRNKVFNDITKFINKISNGTDNKKEKVENYIAKNKFNDFAIDDKIKRNLLDSGYVTPSEIQDKTIAHILNRQDVVGIANTGTGKTASFMIPLVHRTFTDNREIVIILAPTRELAVQIDEEFKKISKGLYLKSALCVGGASVYNQIKSLKSRYSFIIGTPGRIRDLIDRNHISMKNIDTIVLDECDRMLDMGFVHDMKYLMDNMPKPHNTIFFSATHNKDVDKIITEYLHNPINITVKTRDTSANIDQDIIRVKENEKLGTLIELLNTKEFAKTIIFARTKRGVDKLEKDLRGSGLYIEVIHGNKKPNQRNFALKNFKENRSNILIATDVAARGLDIANVSHVINYDLPATYEDYIHRIGRTGRAGNLGKALTFVNF